MAAPDVPSPTDTSLRLLAWVTTAATAFSTGSSNFSLRMLLTPSLLISGSPYGYSINALPALGPYDSLATLYTFRKPEAILACRSSPNRTLRVSLLIVYLLITSNIFVFYKAVKVATLPDTRAFFVFLPINTLTLQRIPCNTFLYGSRHYYAVSTGIVFAFNGREVAILVFQLDQYAVINRYKRLNRLG